MSETNVASLPSSSSDPAPKPSAATSTLLERLNIADKSAVVENTQEAEEVDDEVLGEDGEEAEDASEDTENEPEDAELPESIKEILAKNRKELREAKAELKAAQKELHVNKGDGTEDPAAAPDNTYKELFLANAAKAALTEAGITTGVDRFLKMIDFTDVDADATGAVTGLAEQVAAIKEDFAEIFAKPAVKRTTVKGDAAGRAPVAAKPVSSANKIASLMMQG